MKKGQSKKNDDFEEVELVDDSIVEMTTISEVPPTRVQTVTDLVTFDTK